MNKAVIATGGKQYLVKEGDVLNVELLESKDKTASFNPLLVIEDSKTTVGKPIVKDKKVQAKIIEQIKEDKVVFIRYKAKKRVKKIKGHRQQKSKIEITKIS